MPRISSCDYCDYRHIVPDYCIKTECKVYWAMVEQNEKMEEHNRLHRDQPEGFEKPKIVFRPKPQKDQSPPSKGAIPDEPIRRTPEPESS